MNNIKSEYAETQEAFEAYSSYVAIKTHFSDMRYDFFKMKGKLKLTPSSFKNRKDKEVFYGLSKLPNYEKRILAHIVRNPEAYVKDIRDDEKTYTQWLTRFTAINHYYETEMSQYEDLEDASKVVGGQYPKILTDHLNGKVSLETLTAFDIVTESMDKWKSQIQEPFLFPTLYKKVRKYRPFLSIDKHKLTKNQQQ